MKLDAVRECCLSKKFAVEDFPFDEDTLVFKVNGKMFALISVENPDTINLKCDPEKAVELRESYEEIEPGFHMSKVHWNTVSLTGRLDNNFIKGLIDHSYEMVIKGMSKKDRLKIMGE